MTLPGANNRRTGATDRALALSLALTPLITINASYALAAGLRHVPACIPYLVGCTSTSSTGRAFPERLIFSGLLASAWLIALFWRRCATHIESTRAATRMGVGLRWLGLVAALSLAIYALSVGPRQFGSVRRAGVVGFILAQYAAQILYLIGLRRTGTSSRSGKGWLVALCVALPVLALGAELAKWLGLPGRAIDNVLEWNSVVFASAFFLIVGLRFLPARAGLR